MAEPPLDRWGIDADLTPLPGGHRNRVYRTTGLTNDLVIKSTRRSEVALAWLDGLQSCAVEAGFVVPRLVASSRGRLVEDGWTCEPYLDGRAFLAEELPEIALAVDRFHELASGIDQRPGFNAASRIGADGESGDIRMVDLPPSLAAACTEAWGAVAARPETGIHGDLNPSNLRWADDGRPILLDWDECRVDAALFDLAQVDLGLRRDPAVRRALDGWEIASCWTIEPDRARALAKVFLAA